jgi:NADH:flavin oxidoreductase / NADH oxidase family
MSKCEADNVERRVGSKRPSAVVIQALEVKMKSLFSPIKIGPYQLEHRVVMAPLTRMRSDPGDIPSNLMLEY